MPAWAQPTHAIALHETPKYQPGFTHFDYVNPSAPKGGKVTLSAIGTFDNLNPFILKGVAATGINMTFDTLLEASADEAFSEYGLVAQSVEQDPENKWVIFNLRESAHFHNNLPITAQDVVYTFEQLKTKGHPFYRAYYADITKAEMLNPQKVKFTFKTNQNRELPLIIGQMPILSKANLTHNIDFEKTTLVPLMGSGPYRVAAVNPGRSITFQRVENYWGADLPVNKGRYNFDTIRYDYYRDATVALEAFKAGEYDFRQENIAKNWATSYNFPARDQQQVIAEEITHQIPTGMQGYVMNTRRDLFKDRNVRAALAYAFDFNWTNKALFHDSYTRTKSYFSNSELAATGLPSEAEKIILKPYKDLPPEIFTQAYEPPETDGTGNIRDNLKKARDLLHQAGWELKNETLVNQQGQKFEFEILLVNPSFERVTLPFAQNLTKLGIKANIRTVDAAQYQKRLEGFDFDMTVIVIGQSLNPGNEQRDYWSSINAHRPGSRNYAGINNQTIDDLVEKIIAAPNRKNLITYTHALDRVLLWNHYVIPHWHIRSFRIAYWNKFNRPEITPKYALGFLDNWWVDPEKSAALAPTNAAQQTPAFPFHFVILIALGILAFVVRRHRKRMKKQARK